MLRILALGLCLSFVSCATTDAIDTRDLSRAGVAPEVAAPVEVPVAHESAAHEFAAQEPAQQEAEPGGLAAQIKVFREAHGSFLRNVLLDPLVRLEGTWMPDASIRSEQGNFDMVDVMFDATVPVPMNRDEFLVVGALAGVRDVQFDNVDTIADETLHRYALKMGYGKFISDELVLQAYWEPSIYSDLDGTLNSRDYRLWYGTALGVWQSSENVYWKFGIRLTDAIDTGVIPLGGVTWHFKPKWRFDALLPRNLELRYTPSEEWHIRGGFQLASDEYHVRGPASLGKPEHDIHIQEIVAFVGTNVQFHESLAGIFQIGTVIAGHHDWGYGNGTPRFDGTLDPSLFLRLGVNLVF